MDGKAALSSNSPRSSASRDEEMALPSQTTQGNAQDPDPQETFSGMAAASHQRNVRFADEQEQAIQGDSQEDQQMTSEPQGEDSSLAQLAGGSAAVPSALGSAANPIVVDN
jgi:hypothetical protein